MIAIGTNNERLCQQTGHSTGFDYAENRDFYKNLSVEIVAGFWFRLGYSRVAVKRFGYVFDPFFLACCALYAVNRWLIKPHTHIAFFHNWFNDALLIPCALPPLLLAHDLLRLRP